MAEESKSFLQKAIEEMLERAKLYQQSPQAQVNAQMSAKDPNFAAGAVVGQLLGDYIGRQLRNRQKEQSVNDADQLSAAGLAAGRQALPVDTNALQQQFLGSNNPLTQAADDELWNRLKGVRAPFAQGW